MNSTIEFKFSKIHVYTLLILNLSILLFPLYLLFSTDFNKSPNPDILPGFLFGLLYLAFAFALIKYYWIPTIRGKAALEINEQGITEYITNSKVNWDNVSDIHYEGIWPNTYIAVEVRNEKIVLSQKKNFFGKLSLRINILRCGTPFIINTRFIKGKKRDIFATLMNYYNQAKSRA